MTVLTCHYCHKDIRPKDLTYVKKTEGIVKYKVAIHKYCKKEKDTIIR